MIFSWVDLIGNINVATPKFVIDELAQLHGIEDENINILKKLKSVEFVDYSDEFVFWASIMNPLKNWTEESINEVKDWIKQFDNTEHSHLCKSLEKLDYGDITPEKPRSINNCLLYHLYLCHELPVTDDITPLEMKHRLILSHKSSNYIIDSIVSKLNHLDRKILEDIYINISNATLINRETDNPMKKIDKVAKELENHENVLKRLLPSSKTEAICLAALNYQLDISNSTNPMLEYFEIMKHINQMKTYNGLELTTHFNPNFPESLYSQETLNKLANEYGPIDDDPYTHLQSQILMNNFYIGKYPSIQNKTTLYLHEEIDELKEGEIICYGVRDQNLIAYTPEEIIGIIRSKNIFDKNTFRRLKILLEKNYKQDNVQIIKNRNSLKTVITEFELKEKDSDSKIKNFLDLYKISDKSIFLDNFQKLLELAMYMRGWNGNGPYPLKDKQTNLNESYLLVSKHLIEFQDLPKDLLFNTFLELPLLRFYDNEYHIVSDATHGISIAQRLEFIKRGESHENDVSCIRFSSNFLCSCIAGYGELLKLDKKFDMRSVEYIQ